MISMINTSRDKMGFDGKKLLHFWFFVLLGLGITEVTAITSCPQQPESEKSEVSVNERAQKLEGTSTFQIYDKEKHYLYTITLCREKGAVAVRQDNQKQTNNTYSIGYFDGAHLVGGRDWLMITYYGSKYGSHCGGTRRRSIFFIQCDQSATTKDKRRPKFVEEYAPPGKKPDESLFCYYLFEMKHSAACQELPKTKISPGSVFIIIVVVVGVLCLVLGFLLSKIHRWCQAFRAKSRFRANSKLSDVERLWDTASCVASEPPIANEAVPPQQPPTY